MNCFQVLIPMLINSLPKEICKLHHLQFICGTRRNIVADGNELISMSSSFFDHQFPLRRKSVSFSSIYCISTKHFSDNFFLFQDSENQELIRRAPAELDVVSPFHEQEALAALSAAREKRILVRNLKLQTIFYYSTF